MLATYRAKDQDTYIDVKWDDFVKLIDKYAELKPVDLPKISKFIGTITDKHVIKRQEIIIDENIHHLMKSSILLKYFMQLSKNSYHYEYLFQRRNIIAQGIGILRNHIVYAVILRAKDFFFEKTKPGPISWISTFFINIKGIIDKVSRINEKSGSYLRDLESNYKTHLDLEKKLLSEVKVPFDVEKYLQLCEGYLTATVCLLQNMQTVYENKNGHFSDLDPEKRYASIRTVKAYIDLFKVPITKLDRSDDLRFIFNNLCDKSAEASLVKEETVRLERIFHERSKFKQKKLNEKFNAKCKAIEKITFGDEEKNPEDLNQIEKFIKSLSAKIISDASQLLSFFDDVNKLQENLNVENKDLSNKEALAIAEYITISFASLQVIGEDQDYITIFTKIQELTKDINQNSLDGLRLRLLIADLNQTRASTTLKQLNRNKYKLVERDKRGYLKIVATEEQLETWKSFLLVIGQIITEFDKDIQHANNIISNNPLLLTDEINSYIAIMHDDHDKTIQTYQKELKYYKEQNELAKVQRDSFLKALFAGRIPAKDPNQPPSNTFFVQQKLLNDQFDATLIQIYNQVAKTSKEIFKLKSKLSKKAMCDDAKNPAFSTDMPIIPSAVRFLRRNSFCSLREWSSQEEFLPLVGDGSTPNRDRSYSVDRVQRLTF